MTLMRLIYASRPFGYDNAMLAGILVDARRSNLANDITGSLIARADLYLQLLEGPEAAVRGTYNRIRRDDRHVDVQLLVYREAAERLFAGWTMRDDPAKSWMWTREDLARGALQKTTPEEIEAVFERHRSELSV
ncbi:BLUF domain-containing protein [Thalassococcus sp. BH17M4-6]|uniref:BLUF domain-containing protein n=1 Tax=Thalassococcus sp. BH17M4-6 TaxID=3413148 RepID=UPI003BBD390E